ncbi:MAG: hypothetical protein Q4A06_09065 [Cardiobacteriaceae bacterium]|nr:hypothetical protein [Cardiobacteriaceae bacterium]
MKTALPALVICLLAACVQSEYRGDYHHHSHVRYGSGQSLHHSNEMHWQESGYIPPAVDLHLQHGGQSLSLHQAPPAPPPVIYAYPAPVAPPSPPYIRSERRFAPLCAQQTRVQHDGQIITFQHPCQ